jgi:hypothetical protein
VDRGDYARRACLSVMASKNEGGSREGIRGERKGDSPGAAKSRVEGRARASEDMSTKCCLASQL